MVYSSSSHQSTSIDGAANTQLPLPSCGNSLHYSLFTTVFSSEIRVYIHAAFINTRFHAFPVALSHHHIYLLPRALIQLLSGQGFGHWVLIKTCLKKPSILFNCVSVKWSIHVHCSQPSRRYCDGNYSKFGIAYS